MSGESIPVNRISYRDAQTYFTILLDDNNRKPICRIYLNGNKKYVGTFDEQKKEAKVEINTIDDIFNLRELFIKTAQSYG